MNPTPPRFAIAGSAIALVLGGLLQPAVAAKPVRQVTAEDKGRCRFVDFIDIGSQPTAEAALAAAADRVRFLKGDSLYVRQQVEDAGKGVSLSGEALRCGG